MVEWKKEADGWVEWGARRGLLARRGGENWERGVERIEIGFYV